MRKLLLLFVLLFSVTFASNAERVRSSVAKNVAKTMLPNAELVDISSESNFNNVYIFSSDNGFVIVSADDRAFPVIAYSDKNPFKVKDMSENVYSWLKSVDKGIQNIVLQWHLWLQRLGDKIILIMIRAQWLMKTELLSVVSLQLWRRL